MTADCAHFEVQTFTGEAVALTNSPNTSCAKGRDAAAAGKDVIEPGGVHLRNGGDQLLGIGMVRRRENLRGRALRDDLASQHHRGAVRDAAHGAEIVGDEHIGEAQLVLQALQELQDLFRDQRIQGGRRLVANDDFGLGRERAGDADALLLAAGELAGTATGEILGKADLTQELRDAGLGRRT